MAKTAMVASSGEFSIGSVLSQSWQTFKSSWLMIYGVIIVTAVISSILGSVGSGRTASDEQSILPLIMAIVSMLVSFFLQIGQIRIFLGKVRQVETPFSWLWSGADAFVQFAWGSFRLGLLVVLGSILLIIPGIYAGLKYMFVPYLIADRKLTADQAFKASALMTQGKLLSILALGLVAGLVGLSGILLLGIGLLVTAPISMLTTYVLYVMLLPRLDGTEYAG